MKTATETTVRGYHRVCPIYRTIERSLCLNMVVNSFVRFPLYNFECNQLPQDKKQTFSVLQERNEFLCSWCRSTSEMTRSLENIFQLSKVARVILSSCLHQRSSTRSVYVTFTFPFGGGGARRAAVPPNFGQLRFFGQQEKISAKPVLKDVSMFCLIILKK